MEESILSNGATREWGEKKGGEDESREGYLREEWRQERWKEESIGSIYSSEGIAYI